MLKRKEGGNCPVNFGEGNMMASMAASRTFKPERNQAGHHQLGRPPRLVTSSRLAWHSAMMSHLMVEEL